MKGKEMQSPTLDGSWSGQLVREPLVHFLVLGGLLFGAYYFLNGETPNSDSNRIVVDEAQVARKNWPVWSRTGSRRKSSTGRHWRCGWTRTTW
jgi:hypothetical protein